MHCRFHVVIYSFYMVFLVCLGNTIYKEYLPPTVPIVKTKYGCWQWNGHWHYNYKPKLSDYLNNSNMANPSIRYAKLQNQHFVVNNQSETLFCNICQQIIRKISIRKKYHINMYITTYNIVWKNHNHNLRVLVDW